MPRCKSDLQGRPIGYSSDKTQSLWTAKLSISEFLRRLTDHVWRRSYEIGLQCVRWFLALTFLAIFIATLAECQPFPKYWQVVPDPGPRCRQGYAQIITMGVSDVLTDFVLVGFPIPIIIKSTIAIKQYVRPFIEIFFNVRCSLTVRKISLVMLFGLSLFLVGITLYRVVSVIDRHSEQQYRSLLASLEILAAAVVSNALVLGSFVRDRGLKKQRYRFDSIAGSSSLDRSAAPRATLTAQKHWGSDADLVGDLGIKLHEGLSAGGMPVPRPAPVAIPRVSQAKHLRLSADNEDWEGLQEQSSAEAEEIEAKNRHNGIQNTSQPGKKKAPSGGLSFFDVGGLLDDDTVFSTPCNRTSTKQSQASSKRFLSRTRTGMEQRTGHQNPLSRTRTETEEYTAPHNRQGKEELLRTLTLGSIAPSRRNRSSNKGFSRQGPSSMRGKGIENSAPFIE